MAKKNKTTQTKSNYPIGKQAVKPESKQEADFYAKHKSTIWTIIVLVILTIFFIINNTREIPDEGPYPPNYHKDKIQNEAMQ
ncbi:MAG: hypothetical protein IPM14_05365 [bacterium]|nr:hypothetical protein [bacterium]